MARRTSSLSSVSSLQSRELSCTSNGDNDAGARHACDQGDGLSGYTWTEHDPREGGVQVLNDPQNNVKVTTELLKVQGGEHGGSWAARIKGEPLKPGKHQNVLSFPDT